MLDTRRSDIPEDFVAKALRMQGPHLRSSAAAKMAILRASSCDSLFLYVCTLIPGCFSSFSLAPSLCFPLPLSLFISRSFRCNREETFSTDSSGRVYPYLRLVVPVKKALGIGLAPNEEERIPEGSMRCRASKREVKAWGMTTRPIDDEDKCLHKGLL